MLKRFFVLVALISTNWVTAASTPQWPFDQPSPDELHKSSKKVFIHYFTPFPISIDNRDPDNDYYAKGFISPDGEKGKHKSYGGYFRQRPLPRLPRNDDDWVLEDLIDEVKMAQALGVDGFCVDILDTDGKRWNQFMLLLKAVNKAGGDFKIVLMPDMEAQLKAHPEYLVPAICKIADNPALYRLDDGRLVLVPYDAHRQTPEWWKNTISELEAKGIKVAFMPLFQGWWKYIDKYADFSYGFSDWGTNTFDDQHAGRRPRLKAFDRHGLKFMAPVRPQDFRPKNFHGSESRNSALFREMWATAMESDVELVHLITWNDYSEASEIAPSTGIRHTFYDLTAYYTTWFKTGKQPEIVRDAIYYFYRTQPTDAKVDLTRQKEKFKMNGKPCNEIELLAFMKEPSVLEINIGGKIFTKECPAGINSFSVPLADGRPEFKLIRAGKTIMAKTGAWEIFDKVVYDDLLVHGDGGTAEVVRTYDAPRKMPSAVLKFGRLLRKADKPEKSDFESKPGIPGMVKLPDKPYDRPLAVTDGKGSFTVSAGPGKSKTGGSIEFGQELSLKTGEEAVFKVKRLEMTDKSGWVAVFLSIGKADGGRVSLTLRDSSQTYISSALPLFKVVMDNFPVQYPAVYRIRKNTGSIDFVYNNTVMYSYKESDQKEFDKISIYAGCENEESAALIEIASIELREIS